MNSSPTTADALGHSGLDEALIRNDLAAYLRRHEEKDLLRLLTCGSVDDGKSTLIGRLLYDCHLIYEDQLAAVMKDSKVHGTTGGGFDPALLTDGLKAEREQGITIDVAYRYFSTGKRTFIIADCPGHEQYTRNMATGASTCNLAVILIDARHGVMTQTRRHSFICSLLGIRHALIAVNKMDCVEWSESVFEKIRADYNACAARLTFADIHFIPISALRGDNVVHPSDAMPWYRGPTLLHHIETVNIVTDRNLIDLRFPVQYVLRPHLDFRGFAGSIASGVLRRGDEVVALPGRRTSRIRSILTAGGERDEAVAPMSVTVTLEDEIDVSRGTLLAPVKNQPRVDDEFEAMVVWMDEAALAPGRSYLVKLAANTVPGQVSAIRYKMDVNTLRRIEPVPGETAGLALNEIGRCHVSLHRPIAFDPYTRNRATGSFILIDRVNNLTVGAGMIMDRVTQEDRPAAVRSRNLTHTGTLVSPDERETLLGQRGCTLWLTGLSGAGKSTIAQRLEKDLIEAGHACFILDGDNVRYGLNRDLGFSAAERSENIRRIAEVAALFNDAGVICITALISPYVRDRARARAIINRSEVGGAGLERFVEVHVSTSLDVCEQRDPKGLYQKARAGQIQEFTGISDPYEPPEAADVVLDTAALTAAECSARLLATLAEKGVVK